MTFTARLAAAASMARRHPRRLAAALAGTLVVAAGLSVLIVRDVLAGLPDDAALHGVGSMAQATTLYDRTGRPAFTIYREQRIEVPLAKMSPALRQAILAIEDQRFYAHGGVDVIRVLGAALSNLRAGRAAQGGSTITQQLARQSFLTPDKTIRRKLKEIVVASRLERRFTKDEILELYLNKVYFGNGLYGVEAASLGYFGKHASELDLAEAALLAGLVKSPSTYAPTVSLDRATARRAVVLEAMRSAGVIDAAAYDRAAAAPVHLVDGLRSGEGYGQYFKEEVRRQLVQRFGWERVYEGGLRVYTTIDLDLQKAADAQVTAALEEIEDLQVRRAGRGAAGGDPLQAALVALDPATGEVLALVGGRDFTESSFNRATQARRQPGSAFKPFVYAAAIEQGLTPSTLITNLNEPTMTLQGEWVPEDGHSTADSMTMRAALRTSSNRAAVRMLHDIGIPAAVEYASRLGLAGLPRVPSLALGSGEVTLLSMTAAFGAFANRGLLAAPTLIRRVEDRDGTVLFEHAAEPTPAVSETTAFLMSAMMADVVNAGTAASARRWFTLPAAGKTGTTNDYHDAWFVGYTPRLVAGVWVGFDQPRTIMRGGYASQLAVPLWARFMASATSGHPPEWFSPPRTVVTATICRLSGKLATDACRAAHGDEGEGQIVYAEVFALGTEPTAYCDVHRTVHAPAPGVLAASSPIVGRSGAVTAPRVLAPEVVAAAPLPEPAVDEAPPPPQPERRRGFWSRLFRRGGDDGPREQSDQSRPGGRD